MAAAAAAAAAHCYLLGAPHVLQPAAAFVSSGRCKLAAFVYKRTTTLVNQGLVEESVVR
jgi:hypothetical protein